MAWRRWRLLPVLVLALAATPPLGTGGAAAEGPCAGGGWSEKQRLLVDLVGDGRQPPERLAALRATTPPQLEPSACVFGAAAVHLLTVLGSGTDAWRLQELSQASELLVVVVESPWLDIGAAGFPLFGLLHLAQSMVEAVPMQGSEDWHPLASDDHLRFRNWIVSHLAYGQTPPLVDSVHFLARADPREPGDVARECSVAKAMGYLATAWVFVQEADDGLRAEARDLVHAAERHVKACVFMEQGPQLTLLRMLQTKWPLWWLLHTVLTHLDPASVGQGSGSALAAVPPRGPAVGMPLGAKVEAAAAVQGARADEQAVPPLPRTYGCDQGSREVTILCDVTPGARATFQDMGGGLFFADVQRLEDSLGGLRRFVQLFRDGSPLHRRAAGDIGIDSGADTAPFWAEVHVAERTLIALYDSAFASGSTQYAVSLERAPSVGIYAEAGSASDPYNNEWLQAYQVALARMGLPVHIITRPEEAQPGVAYFWRINQMFEGGRFAFAPGGGVGQAIAAHLVAMQSHGDVGLWPRPETMQFYQDKIALKALFDQAGIPQPKSWVVTSLGDFEQLLRLGELKAGDFPLILKHPYAASSRGMVGVGSLAEASQVLAVWLAEHQVPCLLQQRVRIGRDLRITYVGGEIIHGYWRVKADSDSLSTATGVGGSSLDFQIPRAELAPFVREFASRTGIDVGGMDIAFPEGSGPVVFEVSPIFDLNPEPPAQWAQRPYKEYKQTDDYTRRRAEAYAQCAQRIAEYALRSRRCLFVDIDNTVNDAINRIRRAAFPAWPGETFDSARAFSETELASDRPLPGSVEGVAAVGRDWDVSFLTARGEPGVFGPTASWLEKHGFRHSRLILVNAAREKAAWLKDAAATGLGRTRCCAGRPVLLVDDLTRAHYRAAPEADEEVIRLLEAQGTLFQVFRPDATPWATLPTQLEGVARTIEEALARNVPVR